MSGAIPLTACTPVPQRIASRRTGKPLVAITIDDFDLVDGPLLSGVDRDEAIRSTLRQHKLQAAGFITGKNVDGRPLAERLVKAWSDENHVIGNHTYSHRYYSGRDPRKFIEDVLKCEAVLERYAGFQKLFRFPFLAEGNDAPGRDRARQLLRQFGYRNGHVTIDTSDWYVNDRLKARLKTNAAADVAGYRRYYLQHMWMRATYYDGLARQLFGRPFHHTLLLHHNLTTALFLEDVIAMFKQRGWDIINADVAFASPEFQLDVDSLPAGQSLLWATAKARGGFEKDLRYPAEDGKYEQTRMDALGL